MIANNKILILLTCLQLLFGTTSFSQVSQESHVSIDSLFKTPPNSAKPRGYWIWPHGNFDYSRISEELQEFKEYGLGGVDIYDMGITDKYDQIPKGNSFLGEKMLDGIVFALTEAKRLGLKMGLGVSNGWNAGGEWTEPEEKLMRLLIRKDTIKGPILIKKIGFPKIPTTFKKSYGLYNLYPKMNPDGFPEYYKDVALYAYPLSKNQESLSKDNTLVFDVKNIKKNDIKISLPEGDWVLNRAVVTPIGQKMWMNSDNTKGFVMDHYSKQATKNHFNQVIERLESRLGNLENTALERLYLASFEAENYIIWSPEFTEEFYNHHGYNIIGYIPALDGNIVGNEEITQRFLEDYRSTVSEMFLDNHYKQARRICHEHGILLASESGGPGPPLHYVPTEDLKALGSVDIMRGEFWGGSRVHLDVNGNNLLQVVKNIASAAHIYGHKVVEMESFTSLGNHWEESPFELKILADKAFCEGMNRVVYHTMPHSPKEAGNPGWSYGAGTHMSPKMTWWNFSKPFHKYLSRTSALLQEGLFVADVAYFYGEKIPNFASGPKFIREGLGKGYGYDDLNKEILLKSSVTKDGKLMLPSGMTYNLLVLSKSKRMSLEVLQKIEELLKQGATILGNRPNTVIGLKNFKERDEEFQLLANKIWGNSSSKKGRIKYGKGLLITGEDEKHILTQKGLGEDFKYLEKEGAQLDYIHRKTDNEDIYFISNQDSISANKQITFRIHGKVPYLFDPESGEVKQLALFSDNGKRTVIKLNFEPHQALFVVFKQEYTKNSYVTKIQFDKKTCFPSEKINQNTPTVFYNSNGDISMSNALSGKYTFTLNDGKRKKILVENHLNQNNLKLKGPWKVTFEHGFGFPPTQEFKELLDWSKHKNKELSNYSGTATYSTSFEIQEDFLNDSSNYVLNLGDVREVSRVYINGQEVSVDVFPPYKSNITDKLRKGTNNIVIDVANTWLNRLIADKDRPLLEQKTGSNLGSIKKGRPWKNKKPNPSGLLGPVTLEVEHFNILKN